MKFKFTLVLSLVLSLMFLSPLASFCAQKQPLAGESVNSCSACCAPQISLSIVSMRIQGDKFIYTLQASASGCPYCCPGPYHFNWTNASPSGSAFDNPQIAYSIATRGRCKTVWLSVTSSNMINSRTTIQLCGFAGGSEER